MPETREEMLDRISKQKAQRPTTGLGSKGTYAGGDHDADDSEQGLAAKIGRSVKDDDADDSGAPKRESFAGGLAGESAFAAAKRAYASRKKPSAQKVAIANKLQGSNAPGENK